MNTTPCCDPPPALRSEAFAEDLVGYGTDPSAALEDRRLRRLSAWLPIGVALLGVAFAVVPPFA